MSESGSGEFVYSATLAPQDSKMAGLLQTGDIEILGLMPWSSNGTYLVRVQDDADHAPAIYKPHSGERPLWDFPDGLWRREVAAHTLSRDLGFDLVPTTVGRDDAPLGRGSVQAFVPARFDEHYFTFRDRPELDDTLRSLAAFDLVANSADRKSGHCLLDANNRIWAIDNGLCFHVEFKVRTVLWDYAGDPIPAGVAQKLAALVENGASSEMGEWLSAEECAATVGRARRLLASGRFPYDATGRRYPWPLV